ncbi:MAG TPA: hypothetical protein VK589_30080 [Chryseolinea sp.]|nr:hypothetical protein [Chryseolinea sp.]
MKTLHIVLGIAAVGGVIWYLKNKKDSSPNGPAAQDPAAATGVIPKPPSEATKIIKIADSLLQNTSGNTGIKPPVVIGADRTTNTIPVRQASQLKIIQTNVAMKGLAGIPFILN